MQAWQHRSTNENNRTLREVNDFSDVKLLYLVLSVGNLMKYCREMYNGIECCGLFRESIFKRNLLSDTAILSEYSVDSHYSVYRSFAAIDIIECLLVYFHY
mmetsp:Transcript_4546/g.6941  ORF Transcript_4546/g.6941 Transcript_4546/m.6941 type:complete len:101 (-) Transcript_4546:282-584(-)